MKHDIIIRLPWPPTVNSYYSHTPRGVYLSRKGRLYRGLVLEAIKEQGMSLGILDHMYVEVTLYPPDRRKRDLDNYMKGLLDACSHADVWEDDSLIDQLEIRRGEVVRGGIVIMEITDAGPVIPYID